MRLKSHARSPTPTRLRRGSFRQRARPLLRQRLGAWGLGLETECLLLPPVEGRGCSSGFKPHRHSQGTVVSEALRPIRMIDGHLVLVEEAMQGVLSFWGRRGSRGGWRVFQFMPPPVQCHCSAMGHRLIQVSPLHWPLLLLCECADLRILLFSERLH